ncbi:hypothetical protein [Bacillus altitudinis]|uniref:hypothetical protein n=1 Tax=Bacillus altitudinis TaxID=293387 RepID=UPI0011A5EF83|nr:hypothetical protein [Bacillus altitudinis]
MFKEKKCLRCDGVEGGDEGGEGGRSGGKVGRLGEGRKVGGIKEMKKENVKGWVKDGERFKGGNKMRGR